MATKRNALASAALAALPFITDPDVRAALEKAVDANAPKPKTAKGNVLASELFGLPRAEITGFLAPACSSIVKINPGSEYAMATPCPMCSRALSYGRLEIIFGGSIVGYALAHKACADAHWSALDAAFAAKPDRTTFADPLTEAVIRHESVEILGAKVEIVTSDRPTPRPEFSRCACGHGADSHVKDHLENLLACVYEGCDCDHFAYPAPVDEAA